MSSSNGGYYLPEPSPYPIIGSIGLFTMLLGFVLVLHEGSAGAVIMGLGIAVIILMMFLWFGKVASESEGGLYNEEVGLSFRMTMMWFIFSEVMFFGAFFGALFYARQLAVPWLAETDLLWPGYEGGWPTAGPEGQQLIGVQESAGPNQFSIIDPWHIPFWNTLILLTSSVTVTIAHHALKAEKRAALIGWLFVTVVLGFLFLGFQIYEYIEAYQHLGLTLGTGVYGATFFMLTGFHGAHVTIGAIILAVVMIRCMRGHFSPKNHFAFEAAAWYWHFVDTVWVGLFIFVYIL
ncbi:MAG: cytochrome c oxidase subunit 3 [Gammaproteobacteria bacterium]|nr:cytochrome c oxidase subunit 3 [Gammaproteobacteria bacterium]